MDDQELDERLRAAARAHNQPPETPREAMWEAIQRHRRSPKVVRRLPPRWSGRPWLPLAAAAAALLAVGVGIGRLTSGPASVSAPTVASEAGAASARWQPTGSPRSSTWGSRRSFSLCSEARSDVAAITASLRPPPAVCLRPIGCCSIRLRASTGVPGCCSRISKLVLAGIAQLSPHSPAQDLELIREGIERGDVMPRLRTAVPAGAVPTQGAL